METFAYWLANKSPPWASYRAFMSRYLVATDKQTGVRPVGFGETYKCLFAKIVIKVKDPESTMACQDDQLCAVIKVEIGGTVQGVQAIWDKQLITDY